MQPQKQQTVRQLIIQIVGFGLKNKKVVRCTAAIFTLLYLSLRRYMQVTFYPYAPAGLYRSAIIAMQLCKNKTISDVGGKIAPNFKVFSFCYLLHCTLCGYLVILRRINRGERRYLFLFCAAFFLILLLLLLLLPLLCRSSRSFNQSFDENFILKIHSLHLCTLYDSWAPPPARPPTFRFSQQASRC